MTEKKPATKIVHQIKQNSLDPKPAPKKPNTSTNKQTSNTDTKKK